MENKILLLAESLEKPADIDIHRAEEAKKRAEARLKNLYDESVDFIVLRKALHLLDPFEKCVRELHRVLKPGGKVFLIKHIIFPGYPLYYLLREGNIDFIRKKGINNGKRTNKTTCI